MFYFDTRGDARAFARKKQSYRPLDLKDVSGAQKRWGVLVFNRPLPEGAKKA